MASLSPSVRQPTVDPSGKGKSTRGVQNTESETDLASVNGLAVALVGPLPPPSGGMANQTRQLAQLLGEAGIRVELVRVNTPYAPAWVERIPVLRAAFRLLPHLVDLWRTAGRVQLVHVMANSGWAWHLFAAPAIWIASLRGRPVLVNYRGGKAEEFFARQFLWLRPTFNRVAAVIVPSGFLQAIFRSRGIEAAIVPNIVDLSHFRPTPWPRASTNIIVTRNLEDLYDIPTAIRAFHRIHAAHPAARLWVAGSGPRRDALEGLVRELGLIDAVVFTGGLENERVAALYESASLMLNPSLADNTPISILESMASGVPIVSTNIGGIPFLVRDRETALLVQPRDPAAMADRALELLGDPALAARLRSAALIEVQQYAWPSVRERLFSAYTQVLGHAAARPRSS